MAAFHPQTIIRRAAQAQAEVAGQLVVLRTRSGSCYEGRWGCANMEDGSVALKDERGGALVWIDAAQVESILFPDASSELLAILTDYAVDPLANGAPVGDLAIKKSLATVAEYISTSFGKSVAVELIDVHGSEQGTQLIRRSVLQLLIHLESLVKALSQDSFALSEIVPRVSRIKLVPADASGLVLNDGELVVSIHWQSPKGRWTYGQLADQFNRLF